MEYWCWCGFERCNGFPGRWPYPSARTAGPKAQPIGEQLIPMFPPCSVNRMVCGTRADSGVDSPVARWCVPNTTVALPYSILCGTGRTFEFGSWDVCTCWCCLLIRGVVCEFGHPGLFESDLCDRSVSFGPARLTTCPASEISYSDRGWWWFAR